MDERTFVLLELLSRLKINVISVNWLQLKLIFQNLILPVTRQTARDRQCVSSPPMLEIRVTDVVTSEPEPERDIYDRYTDLSHHTLQS